ncbi:MAG: hypothetical protein OER77_00795, partial [Myxococcales bacterium]|nr:hypothetical protein [Myxococcales bacterium]
INKTRQRMPSPLTLATRRKKNTNLQRFATGVDLLVHEALNPQLVGLLNQGAERAGRPRLVLDEPRLGAPHEARLEGDSEDLASGHLAPLGRGPRRAARRACDSPIRTRDPSAPRVVSEDLSRAISEFDKPRPTQRFGHRFMGAPRISCAAQVEG